MAKDMQHYIMTARIASEITVPKTFEGENGKTGGYICFSMASNTHVKKDDKGEFIDEASFYTVKVKASNIDSPMAKKLRELQKGAKIVIEGAHCQERYPDPKTGEQRVSWVFRSDLSKIHF